ncbi:MAG: hypothetical protein HWD85_04430 [Flavobacteriaceae bacterium]|nr:hypothetical protein [Flavobacteriaceae bacterium]
MFSLKKILLLLSVFATLTLTAQQDSTQVKDVKVKGTIKVNPDNIDPLRPSKAAFYSAIFPGLGQIYNKKYWKAPIVWGAMATSIYFYVDNNKAYNRYRTAFKLREAGLQDEFTKDDGSLLISRNGLISAQKTLKSNRDLSLLTTVVFYVLQIVEASVNAHLLQFNTSDDLSFSPTMISNPINYEIPKFGLSFTYNF